MKKIQFITLRHILYVVILLNFAFSLNSCYTLRDTTLLQDTNSLPVYEKAAYDDYKIQPNDEIMFRLSSQQEDFVNLLGLGSNMANNIIPYRIYPDSVVDLPFADTVKVGGLTLNQATERIKKKYQEIVPDAEIKLTLANKYYTVIGDAGAGVYPIYKEKLTIYQALAQSGQIQLSGDRKHVKIIRETTNSKKQILEFDIRPKSVIDSKFYYIYPNDIIYIQRSPFSFYKVNNYTTFLGLITSSISLFITVFYFNKK